MKHKNDDIRNVEKCDCGVFKSPLAEPGNIAGVHVWHASDKSCKELSIFSRLKKVKFSKHLIFYYITQHTQCKGRPKTTTTQPSLFTMHLMQRIYGCSYTAAAV